jgi:hypothetical protein
MADVMIDKVQQRLLIFSNQLFKGKRFSRPAPGNQLAVFV